jgi:hypothetical protein
MTQIIMGNYRVWLLALIILFSCSKKEDTPKTCTLSLTPMAATTAGSLQYDVSVTGTATISSITYVGNSGNVTVNNPALPFSANFNVLSGASIAISAVGVAPAGSNIKVSYIFAPNAGANPTTAQASCNQ